jgi:hypothetical protein
MELYQIILLALAAIVAGLYIYKRITGKDILRGIMLSRPVVAALGAAVEAVCNIWPDKKILKTIHTVMKAAIEGAEIAEKAWKMGNLEKDERNAYAKKLVKETLAKAGIEVTPQIELIISGVIEAVCILLPHGQKREEEEEASATPVVRGD